MAWDVFWGILFVTFIVIPLLMIWGFAIADLFMRPDLRGISKILWLFGIIFFPFIGTLAYFITRPATPMPRAEQRADYVVHELTYLKTQHDSGGMSDTEYDTRRRELLAAAG